MKRQVTIWVRSDDEAAKKVAALIGEMGRERMALRARKTAIALLVISSFSCLISALAGYLLHHAVGPSMVLMVAALAGFAAAIFESRHTSSHTIRRTGSRS